ELPDMISYAPTFNAHLQYVNAKDFAAGTLNEKEKPAYTTSRFQYTESRAVVQVLSYGDFL
ncbi:MAG: hypothetical protein K2O57_09580, partial [Acetatifactor sp.]|nr:hypothetical protein [Acetatifactor sp.]